jgi:hypothetical protein
MSYKPLYPYTIKDYEHWLNSEHLYDAYSTITTYQWLYNLTHSHLLPTLDKLKYNLICNNSDFFEIILDYSYNIYTSIKHNVYNNYRSKYYYINYKLDIEQIHYFEDKKFNNSLLEYIKNKNKIMYLCDDESDYSCKFWEGLKSLIYYHIDFDRSVACRELYEKYSHDDEQNMDRNYNDSERSDSNYRHHDYDEYDYGYDKHKF